MPLRRCARPELADLAKQEYDDLGGWISSRQLPVVYSPAYNVKLYRLEKLHPFDACKYEKVKTALEQAGVIRARQFVDAVEATRDILLDVHTVEYVDALFKGSKKLREVTEAPILVLVPSCILQNRLHRPMRYHVGGTMLAMALALETGWAINLGGGMHHAHAKGGSGWCAYDDWMLALRKLRRATKGRVKQAIYIDLDVHQGNGVARDKLRFEDDFVYILDAYNRDIWPGDGPAKAGIDCDMSFSCGCKDGEYLRRLGTALNNSFRNLGADIVMYNAGTDILDGDPLGRCKISAEGMKQRDELVWETARAHKVPICMALSGGYAKKSADVISQCLIHLFKRFKLASTSAPANG